MPTILTITQGGTSETTVDGIKQALNIRSASSYDVTSSTEQTGQYLPSLSLVSDINNKLELINSFFTTSSSNNRVLSISHGGLGSSSVEEAKKILNIDTLENGVFKQPISISNGGTGSTTPTDAIKALLPSENRNDGNVLQVSGNEIVWSSIPTGPSNVKSITLTNAVIGNGTINFNGSSDISINAQYIDPDFLNKVIPVTKGGTGVDSVDKFTTAFGLKSGAKTEIIVDSTEPDPSGYSDGAIWIQFTHEVGGV